MAGSWLSSSPASICSISYFRELGGGGGGGGGVGGGQQTGQPSLSDLSTHSATTLDGRGGREEGEKGGSREGEGRRATHRYLALISARDPFSSLMRFSVSWRTICSSAVSAAKTSLNGHTCCHDIVDSTMTDLLQEYRRCFSCA